MGIVLIAPGLIFAEDDDVAPDIVWSSRKRLAQAVDAVGHLHAAPELVIEVLSPGKANEYRDRDRQEPKPNRGRLKRNRRAALPRWA